MDRSVWRGWAIPWIAAGVVATAAGRAAEEGPWTVERRDGQRLSGELRALDGHELRLAPAGSETQEQALDVSVLACLRRIGPTQPPRAGMVVALVNGDRLTPLAISLAEDRFHLDLGEGQPLRLPRAQVRLIQPDSSQGGDILPGLGALADWEGNVENWEVVAGAFRVRSLPAVLVRRKALAERVRIGVAVAADPALDLWLHLFVRAEGQRPGAGYALHLAGDEVSLERHADAGAVTPVGACRLVQGQRPDRSVDVWLTADAARGRFHLAASEGVVGDWTDPLAGSPPGLDLIVVANRPGAELRRLTVARLTSSAEFATDPLPPAGTDRVHLANGDVVEGDLQSILGQVWTLRREPRARSVRLGTAAIVQVDLRIAPGASSAPPRPATRVSLRTGGEVTATAVALRAGRLQVTSPLWGTASFDLGTVAEIRFGAP